MARKPRNKVPEWFWVEKKLDIINFIIHNDESDICRGLCRSILRNNNLVSFSASMTNENLIGVTIIYNDVISHKNDYVRSFFNLSDYLNFYKIEHRRKKINKIINNL